MGKLMTDPRKGNMKTMHDVDLHQSPNMIKFQNASNLMPKDITCLSDLVKVKDMPKFDCVHDLEAKNNFQNTPNELKWDDAILNSKNISSNITQVEDCILYRDSEAKSEDDPCSEDHLKRKTSITYQFENNSSKNVEKSEVPVKEHTFSRLQDELYRAQEKIKLRDEEVSRLSKIRTEVESELEDLTASLFQEAHKMVREANMRQAVAEKGLTESSMQIDVLTAEVTALKALVLTSTPSRPNPHLHPQLSREQTVGLFKKHRRSPSHFNLKYGRENSPPESPCKEVIKALSTEPKEEALEVDPIVHKEFLSWRSSPTIDRSDPFIARIYREDIDYCLDFVNRELSGNVREAVQTGEVFIEAVNDRTKNNFPRKCALLEVVRQCQYRLRVGTCKTWHAISHMCRNRIISVCDFLNYLRYVQMGLVKSSAHEIYWEIVRLRKEMMLARLGLSVAS